MLSYDDELALSDALVARRALVKQLEADGREPSPDELRIIAAGDEAANNIASAYLPFIWSTASTINSRSADSANTVSYDDLVQEGFIAAVTTANSFNARGSTGHRGVRFARYAGPAISKAMNRLVAKMSTPVKLDVSVIQASWTWNATKAQMAAELGRQPTVEELEERTNLDSEYISDIPHRSAFVNIDNPDEQDVPDGGADTALARIMSDHDFHTGVLTAVLYQVYSKELADMMLSYFGVDRMFPREADDLAEHMGISKRDAREWIVLIKAVLVHPKYRVKLRNAISEAGWTPAND